MEAPWLTPHPVCVYTHWLLLLSEIKGYLTLMMHKSKHFPKHFHIHNTKHRGKGTRVFENHLILLPALTDERIQT